MKKLFSILAIASILFVASCTNTPSAGSGKTPVDSIIVNTVNTIHDQGVPVDSFGNAIAAADSSKSAYDHLPKKGEGVEAWKKWAWGFGIPLVLGLIVFGIRQYRKYKKG